MKRCLLWLVCALLPLCAWAADTQPNIVVFLLDDVGQRDVGAFGNSVVRTPNIDQLAREGTRFTNAFLTTSSCSPSRASLLTGLYPTATGAPKLHDPLPASVTSLPQLLRKAGYYTASVGKWHLGEPFKTHFDRVVEPHEESGAADWLPELARRPKNKPFFFWLASKDAHAPYEAWHPPLLHHNPQTVPLSKRDDDNAFVREEMAGYYDEIARADRYIGLVIAALREESVLENTLVIVLSDNGSQFGGAKTTLYDDGIKTPLVMRFPRLIPAHIANQQLVSAVDLMPTLLALARFACSAKHAWCFFAAHAAITLRCRCATIFMPSATSTVQPHVCARGAHKKLCCTNSNFQGARTCVIPYCGCGVGSGCAASMVRTLQSFMI
jgi:N-sulfoglucosamine sulfohydrolase